MLTGVNHITIAVSNLDKSIDFYHRVLGMQLKATWSDGAYLLLAEQWFCLSVDEVKPSQDYSHIAFNIEKENFERYGAKITIENIKLWKKNSSEGDSLYILDPDENKLEIHVGSLSSRLAKMRDVARDDYVFYEN